MINLRPFYHSFQRAKARALPVKVSDFSLCATLGDQGKFRFPENLPDGPVAGLRYALHFDAGLVAKYLRAYSERLGVTCLERTVSEATQRADGYIDELVFSDGTRLRADLYIDCSGFGGLLIEKTLADRLSGLALLASVRSRGCHADRTEFAAPAAYRVIRPQPQAGAGASRCSTEMAMATSIRAPT